MSGKNRAVFLDRDGVLTETIERDSRPTAPRTLEEFRVYPNAYVAIQKLKQLGFLVVVVTNQPDVAYGTMDEEVLLAMHWHIQENGVDRIYACLHPRDAGCDCRKPNAGMLLRAEEELGIDLAKSYMIGDMDVDGKAAANAGVGTFILIAKLYNRHVRAEYQAGDLLGATRIIETIEKGARR